MIGDLLLAAALVASLLLINGQRKEIRRLELAIARERDEYKARLTKFEVEFEAWVEKFRQTILQQQQSSPSERQDILRRLAALRQSQGKRLHPNRSSAPESKPS